MVKTVHMVIPVSKTNFNRHRYRTMTLKRILELEGRPVRLENGVEVIDGVAGVPVPLHTIELRVHEVVRAVPDSEVPPTLDVVMSKAVN